MAVAPRGILLLEEGMTRIRRKKGIKVPVAGYSWSPGGRDGAGTNLKRQM